MKKCYILAGMVVFLCCLGFYVSAQLSDNTRVKGDVNKDGVVNILDALRTVNIILGVQPPYNQDELWAADCTGDERINVIDVLGIINVILDLGTCVSSCTELDCDDRNPCTHDYCDSLLIQCFHDSLPSGTPCDDGDPCTINDVCVNGVCSGTPKICDDGDPCTDDFCHPLTGECKYAPKICDDNNACTDDSCNPITGECEHTNNSAFCDDGDPCTENDICQNGSCVGTPKDCDDGDPCTDDFCNSSTGECEHIFICNTPPTASFTVNPPSGTTETLFSVDASGSSDDQDPTSALHVRWDWENNGSYDTGWSITKTTSHQYSTTGTKTIKLEVKDTGGLTDTVIHQITVSTACLTVTDIDGNTYQTIQIGDQCWMAENLKVTHYRNGDPIPCITSNSDWGSLTTGAYCNYDNNASNVAIYGRLYNWYAVNDNRNIAPEGWHLPSDAEWKQLEMYLGMSQTEADKTDWRGTNEGGKLKENGTLHWNDPNNGATNESGFTALPGGQRDDDGGYFDMGNLALFWSSTERSNYYAWSRTLSYNESEIRRLYYHEGSGFSVRCVKD